MYDYFNLYKNQIKSNFDKYNKNFNEYHSDIRIFSLYVDFIWSFQCYPFITNPFVCVAFFYLYFRIIYKYMYNNIETISREHP